ncbi:hypothetical protein GRX03_10630 [Halovenus sp. WSH3]|uniref:DUF2335 domain-containing protein n=1 Tax=Halovenus carboxidivorans TaxID=2692199 RepID=A0A6B0T9L6_9EURY|nr:hypothetical protein [Halovenus carboxidivorans]MXR52052.1 hypothetical protein [Halovenus carboxidivorans]
MADENNEGDKDSNPETSESENSEFNVFTGLEDAGDDRSGSPPHAPENDNAPTTGQMANEQPDLNKILANLEDITDLIREYFEQSRENKRVENERRQRYLKHQRKVIFTAAITFIVVIGISALMTFYNALSGDAFTFVLGTLFGAILTFLQNMLGANSED